MVFRHFNLREQPFGVTPDPRYLYASSTHREALASLLYGVESGLGFVTLTANPGMGKTTLLFEALRRMQETARTVFLFQTIATPVDLVRALLIDLGVKDTQGTLVDLQTKLNEVLVEQSATGRRLIVVIDEAQNLDDTVLEAVRMLSNFETSRQKLMQIVLSGQLQLADKLAQPQLLQLRQRISIFAHLEPLSVTETAAYIQHRLSVAGHTSDEKVFTAPAVTLIARESRGIPRNINNICFNALTLGCALQCKTIDAVMIREVLADLNFQPATTTDVSVEPEDKEVRHITKSRATGRAKASKVRAVIIAAGVCAAVSIFTWLILQDYRTLSAHRTVAANSSAPWVAPAASSVAAVTAANVQPDVSSPVLRAAAPAVGVQTSVAVSRSSYTTRLVPVRDGQSLYSICTESFGECRPKLLREIIKINPSISDPNHIVSGQKVAVPVFLPNSVDDN
jgi:general secretion pathway protein A